MFFNKKHKLVWKYHYINGCNEINKKNIDTNPDKQGRWQIIGYIKIKSKALKDINIFLNKYIYLPYVIIKKSDSETSEFESCTFKYYCKTKVFSDMYSLCNDTYLYEDNIEKLIEKIEIEYEIIRKIIINIA